MSLSLSIISYQERSPAVPNSITFNQEGGTIGRSHENNWVLEDPEQYVSGRHAVIEYRSPHYYITDVSSNGVYVNQSTKPLGKNNTIRLSHADKLGIGDYVIAVTVSEDELSQTHPDRPDYPVDEQSLISQEDPFADLEVNTISDFIDNEELLGDDETPVEIVQNTFPEVESDSAIERKGSQPDHDSDLHAYYNSNMGAGTVATEPLQKSDVDHPQAEASFIPENWMDLETTTAAEIKPETQPDTDTSQTFEPSAPAAEKRAQSAPSSQISAMPVDVNTQAEILRRFLQGAGLDDERIMQALHPDIFFIIGKVLQTTVQGAMDVLMARAEIKNEMRLNVTTLRSAENNPIKFSFNVDEALTKLLTIQKKGYMSPVRAVEEAFEDIRAHQIAVLAGMQTTLRSILKRFDPTALEQRLQKTSPIGANIPIHRQAKLWELFEQLYEEIGREAEDDFNHLFGHAFAKAYEEQIKKIKVSQTRDPID